MVIPLKSPSPIFTHHNFNNASQSIAELQVPALSLLLAQLHSYPQKMWITLGISHRNSALNRIATGNCTHCAPNDQD